MLMTQHLVMASLNSTCHCDCTAQLDKNCSNPKLIDLKFLLVSLSLKFMPSSS